MLIINIILLFIIVLILIIYLYKTHKNKFFIDESKYTNFAYTIDYINKINNKSITNYDNYELPKNIYVYWNQPNNQIINSNIKLWKSKVPHDWKIIFINENTLQNHVSKEFINKYKNLNPTRFSDFLRLELLHNHGGVWIDAGIIIIDGNFLDNFRSEMITHKYDATIYNLIDNNLLDTPYLENWFIMAPKNSYYIKDLYKEFNKAFEMDFVKYKKEILIPSSVNLTKTIKHGDNTYLMQHAIVNYLFKIGCKYKLNIKDSYDSMFKLHKLNNWNDQQTINSLLSNNNWSGYYAIKLTSGQRKYIDDSNYQQYLDKINSI